MDDKDIVTDFGNLYRAYKKAKSGKKFNGSTAKFSSMALDGINLLKEQLENQTYKESELNKFTIYEPKERVIESCSFKDKVVQHCLCDNVLHPRLKDIFIKYNSAGQEGKGTLFAMDGLRDHMELFYQTYGLDGWILKCDIRHFFYEIDHEVVKKIVDSYFPDEYIRWLNRCFIDNSSDPGLPLGNQVAQVYALMMLDGMDHMITETLGIELYGRYMDDFYLIHNDKEYLKYCLEEIKQTLSDLKLSLNGKTQIIPFRKGIRFLGFHHYMTADGKYIRKLTGENKRKIKKRLRRWVKAVKSGKMSEKKFFEKYNAWKNHASHGNCIKLIHSMDLYVAELMKGAVDDEI